MIPLIALSQNKDEKKIRPDSATNKVTRLEEVKIIASRGVTRLPEIMGTNIFSGKKTKPLST